MLSKTDAKDLLTFKYEGCRVESGIDLGDIWVFRVFMPIGGGEQNMNPFMSVNKTDGSTKDFSIIGYSDPMELGRLFAIEDAK